VEYECVGSAHSQHEIDVTPVQPLEVLLQEVFHIQATGNLGCNEDLATSRRRVSAHGDWFGERETQLEQRRAQQAVDTH